MLLLRGTGNATCAHTVKKKCLKKRPPGAPSGKGEELKPQPLHVPATEDQDENHSFPRTDKKLLDSQIKVTQRTKENS